MSRIDPSNLTEKPDEALKELSVSVVMPAYNEGEAIAQVVGEVRGALRGISRSEIIVVDDGSKDSTGHAAKGAGATVINHPTNLGYGKALKTGIENARYDFILMIDADGSYPTTEISRLLEHAPEFDLIIGTRTGVHFWGTPMQAFRRWIYLRMASFVVGERIPDANSGLRLVRRSLAAYTGPVECLGFSYSTTMTLTFLKEKRFVKFVPIDFHARVGKSKVKAVRDILRTLQLMAEVLIAYNPLKLFVALATLPAIATLGFGIGWIIQPKPTLVLAISLCAFAGLQCIFVGCLLDSIRMHRGPQK